MVSAKNQLIAATLRGIARDLENGENLYIELKIEPSNFESLHRVKLELNGCFDGHPAVAAARAVAVLENKQLRGIGGA